MRLGFEIEAAKPKKGQSNEDAPSQVRMKPQGIRRNPSTDQKKTRHQLQRRTAAQGSWSESIWGQQWDLHLPNGLSASIERMGSDQDYNWYTFDDTIDPSQSQMLASGDAASIQDAKRLAEQSLAEGGNVLASRTAGAMEDNLDWIHSDGDGTNWPGAYEDGLEDGAGTAAAGKPMQHPENNPENPAAYIRGYRDGYANPEKYKKESSMDTKALNRREREIINAMGSVGLDDQRALAVELEAIRAQRTAMVAESNAIQTADMIIADHLTPAFTAIQHTASTDWIGEDEGDGHLEISSSMAAEAASWWNRVSAAVKADEDELAEQARGYAHMISGRFGSKQSTAAGLFLGQVEHLAKVSAYNPFTDQNNPYVNPLSDADKAKNQKYRDLFPNGVPLHGDLTPEQQAWLDGKPAPKVAITGDGTSSWDTNEVELWISNDQYLYNLAQEVSQGQGTFDQLKDALQSTPGLDVDWSNVDWADVESHAKDASRKLAMRGHITTARRASAGPSDVWDFIETTAADTPSNGTPIADPSGQGQSGLGQAADNPPDDKPLDPLNAPAPVIDEKKLPSAMARMPTQRSSDPYALSNPGRSHFTPPAAGPAAQQKQQYQPAAAGSPYFKRGTEGLQIYDDEAKSWRGTTDDEEAQYHQQRATASLAGVDLSKVAYEEHGTGWCKSCFGVTGSTKDGECTTCGKKKSAKEGAAPIADPSGQGVSGLPTVEDKTPDDDPAFMDFGWATDGEGNLVKVPKAAAKTAGDNGYYDDTAERNDTTDNGGSAGGGGGGGGSMPDVSKLMGGGGEGAAAGEAAAGGEAAGIGAAVSDALPLLALAGLDLSKVAAPNKYNPRSTDPLDSIPPMGKPTPEQIERIKNRDPWGPGMDHSGCDHANGYCQNTLDNNFVPRTAAAPIADSSGQGVSGLPQVDPTSEQARQSQDPITEPGDSKEVGKDAADVANVPTPGGEAGYPQPKAAQLFRNVVQARLQAEAAYSSGQAVTYTSYIGPKKVPSISQGSYVKDNGDGTHTVRDNSQNNVTVKDSDLQHEHYNMGV